MALPDPASGLPVGVAFFFASQTLQFDSVWYFLVVRHVGTKPRYPEEVREEGTPPCLTHFDHSVQICVDLLCYAVVVHVLGTSWHILAPKFSFGFSLFQLASCLLAGCRRFHGAKLTEDFLFLLVVPEFVGSCTLGNLGI